MKNTRPDFSGPYLKAERAEHHIGHLKDIFRRHIRANQKAATPKYNRKPRKNVTIGSPLPRHTATILGDAIHNLRSALDHAYCILTEANGGTINKHVRFPFTEKGARQDLEGSINGHAKAGFAPSAKIINVIFDKIQPFPGGNGEDLVSLHVLDIADKHLILLPTKQRTVIDEIRLANGGVIRGGGAFITSGEASALFVGDGLEPNHKQKFSIEVCFGDGQPFDGQPVLPLLSHLHGRIVETLDALRS